MNKIKLTSVPAESKLKAGDWVTVSGAELDTLRASGHQFITESEDRLICAREVAVDNALKASKAFAPKDTESIIACRADAIAMETSKDGLGVTYIRNLPALQATDRSQRQTSADDGTIQANRVETGEIGLRETVKAFLQASEADHKLLRNGGIIRATKNDVKGIEEAVANAQSKSILAASMCDMIGRGGNFQFTEEFVKATYDGYADPAGALGVLNTAITLQMNLGHLENQLIMLDDITTDVTGTPVLFEQWARSRYIKVPGVMLKTSSNSWGTSSAE